MACPTCKSIGFNSSVLGQDRCEFCGGTFSGNPPEIYTFPMLQVTVFIDSYWLDRAEDKEAFVRTEVDKLVKQLLEQYEALKNSEGEA